MFCFLCPLSFKCTTLSKLLCFDLQNIFCSTSRLFDLFFLHVLHIQCLFTVINPSEMMLNLYPLYTVSIAVFVSFHFLNIFSFFYAFSCSVSGQ